MIVVHDEPNTRQSFSPIPDAQAPAPGPSELRIMLFDPQSGFTDPSNREPEPPTSTVGSPASEPGHFDFEKRRLAVNLRLSALGPQYQEAQIEMATLLAEAHRQQYWRQGYENFGTYVQQLAGISLRTAQELLRVIRACHAVNLSNNEIAKLGWSKLAVVAKHLRPETAQKMLCQVKDMSYGQLKATYSKNAAPVAEKKATTATSRLRVTDVIDEALRLAFFHTRETEMQSNLDFIAEKFLELVQWPSRLPKDDCLN